jgi:hypothetical protein
MYPGKSKPRNAGPYGDVFARPRPDRPYGGVGASWVGTDMRTLPAVGPLGPHAPCPAVARDAGHASWLRMVARVSNAWRDHKR